jgi:oligopeptidase B
MTDPSLALTVHEYDEWTEGRDPRRDGGVEARLRELSPYDSLDLLLPSTAGGEGGRALPPTLLHASLADHRVRYWEAAKYAAKAREVSERGRSGEVLLRMEGDRAHEAPMAQTDVLQEAAYEAAFMITRLGLKDEEEEGEEEGVGGEEEGGKEGGRKGRRRARKAAHQKPRHLGKVPPLVFW